MTAQLKQIAYLAAAAVLVVAMSSCGGSSKKSSSSGTTAATTTASTAAERGEAKRALATWLTLTPKVNASFDKYGKDEPAHARAHDVLAVRRDAYDLRNGVYRFDIAVRKVEFPPSVQTDVNSLLDTTKAMVAALDGVSQSSKVADIDRSVRKANSQTHPFGSRANTVNVELHRLAGVPIK